ncbi:MAG: class I SAM-dependent methyltransferase [Gemmatimonas sp.]
MSNESSAQVPPSSFAGHDVSSAYDRWSAQYDSDRNLTRDLDALVLRENVRLSLDGKSVLEIGCGTGKNSAYLASRAARLTAMDFSHGMLDVARKRVTASHVRFVQHDVRHPWPVADASVDVIVGNLVLEHVEQLAFVYAEASRVLRDGGQLYFCELHPFRQLRGGQAHFVEESSGDTVPIIAFVHSVSDYINPALASSLTLSHIGEWSDADAAPGALPRLFSVQFTRATRS